MKLENLGFGLELLTPEIVEENDLYLHQVIFPPDPNIENDTTHPHLSLSRVRLKHQDRFEYECLDNATKFFSMGTHYYGKTEGMIIKENEGRITLYVDSCLLLKN